MIGETQSQTTDKSCKTRTCTCIVCESLTDIQEAEASGSGAGNKEVMQKNDQGDEFLKVSQADLGQQILMGSYLKTDD